MGVNIFVIGVYAVQVRVGAPFSYHSKLRKPLKSLGKSLFPVLSTR